MTYKEGKKKNNIERVLCGSVRGIGRAWKRKRVGEKDMRVQKYWQQKKVERRREKKEDRES